MRRKLPPGTCARVGASIQGLADLPFPDGVLDDVSAYLLASLGYTGKSHPANTRLPAKTFVYLAFYGHDGKAECLKIGISRDVRIRISGTRTNNPIPFLWAYSAEFRTRKDARLVEKRLLGRVADGRIHGEWSATPGWSRLECDAIAECMAEISADILGFEVVFAHAAV